MNIFSAMDFTGIFEALAGLFATLVLMLQGVVNDAATAISALLG